MPTSSLAPARARGVGAQAPVRHQAGFGLCRQVSRRTTSAARYCEKHGVPIFPTIMDAVSVGTKGVPVEGVLIIGEHGRFVHELEEAAGLSLAGFFDEVVHAFRMLGRRVPVFSDKHLSYEWPFARWMVELAKHEDFPFMAGSSLPVAWRVPHLSLPIGSRARARPSRLATATWRAMESTPSKTLQCMTERRKGGETGRELGALSHGKGGVGGRRPGALARRSC